MSTSCNLLLRQHALLKHGPSDFWRLFLPQFSSTYFWHFLNASTTAKHFAALPFQVLLHWLDLRLRFLLNVFLHTFLHILFSFWVFTVQMFHYKQTGKTCHLVCCETRSDSTEPVIRTLIMELLHSCVAARQLWSRTSFFEPLWA